MIFSRAENQFSLLRFYYNEIIELLDYRAKYFLEFTDHLEQENKERERPFDKEDWLKHFDVFGGFYPKTFRNSFIISACALFESQVKSILDLVKEEHRVPLEWDDLQGSVPTRIKNYLWHGGIVIKDDPPIITLPPPDYKPTPIYPDDRFIADDLWDSLDNYFRVRNCMVHHGGVLSKMRYRKKITEYAINKKIIENHNGNDELNLDHEFNREVCENMMDFFSKLHSAYYSTPLPADK